MSLWIHDNYYEENKSHILGEPYETSGRFGTVIKYRGNREQALARIDRVNYEIARSLSPFVSMETPIIRINPTKRQKRRILHALQHTDTPTEQDLLTFDDIDREYNKHLSRAEIEAFVYYMRIILGRPMQGGWKKYHKDIIPLDWIETGAMMYDNGTFVPRFIYLSGNVYQKKKDLEANEKLITEKWGRKVYETQYQAVDEFFKKVYAKRLTLDHPDPKKRLRLLPTSDFVANIQIKGLKGDVKFKEKLSKKASNMGGPGYFLDAYDYQKEVIEEVQLRGAFVLWMKNNSRTINFRKGISWLDIAELYLNDKKRGRDEDADAFKKRKTNAKNEGIRLFAKFLAEEISTNDKVRIELLWNQQFNAFQPVDFNQVPIGFKMAKTYNGMELDIRPEKREAIAFAMLTGSGCLAYGVGLGKTWAASFIIAQFIENGWCTRPMLVMPNQVYKQFIKEFSGLIPWVKVNGLYNLSDEYVENLPAGNVPEQSLTAITYEGFRRMGIRPENESEFFNTLSRVLWMRTDNLSDKREKKRLEKFNEKLQGMIGKSQTGATLYIQDLGIDFMAVDEAHACKKVFTNVVGQAHERLDGSVKKNSKPYKLQSGAPSYMGLKGFMFAQYIQQQNPTGNVLLLTATPFTNSPLEVYSMLALVGFKHLKETQLDNIIDFFDNFIEVKNSLVINVSLNPEFKEVFVGFSNLPGLQGLIRRFFLYKQTTKNLKRPNKIVLPIRQKMVEGELTRLNEDEKVDTIIPLSPVQRQYMNDIIAYSEGNLELVINQDGKWICANNLITGEEDDIDIEDDQTSKADKEAADDVGAISESSLDGDEKNGVRLLRAANYARSLALSPYLYACHDLGEPDYKSYVETSSKFTFTMQCIQSVKAWHEQRNEPVSGQVIYMDRGVQFFPFLKEYLVKELGFKEHEVGIITGQMKGHEDKSAVQDKFLGRRFNQDTKEYEPIPDQFRIKVLIGSGSIKEGINLQTHSTVLYDLFLDWNPTDVVQLEGRVWRQGNRFKNVRIVYPLMEDSMDIFMFQKLEEKTARINAIWDFDANEATLNLEDFDPKELKYALIKDPVRVAALEVKERVETIDDDIANVQAQIKMLGEFESAKEKVFREDTLDTLYNFAKAYRLDLKEEVKADPNRLQRLITKILRDQLLWDGRPAIELKEETQDSLYTYRNPYKEARIYQGVIQELWEFQSWKSSLRKYNKAVDDILKPRNIPATDEGLKLAKEKLEAQKEEFEQQKEKVSSEDAIKNRAKEIILEREKSGYQPASVTDRVTQFARLNYLLAERRVEIETGSGATKNPVYAIGEKVKFDGKQATVQQVFADRNIEVMYRIKTPQFEELVFENELEPTNARQRKALQAKTTGSPIQKLQELQANIIELRRKLVA